MARRRSGLQPLHLAGAAAFLLVAGGAYWFFSRDKTDHLKGDHFSAVEYETNHIGMRGGTYVVTGTIERQLRNAPDGQRLFTLDVKPEGSGKPVPVGVLVPASITMNIQIGQEFEMSVLVNREGVLQAREIRKS